MAEPNRKEFESYALQNDENAIKMINSNNSRIKNMNYTFDTVTISVINIFYTSIAKG